MLQEVLFSIFINSAKIDKIETKTDKNLEWAIKKQVEFYKNHFDYEAAFDRMKEYGSYINNASNKTGLPKCLIEAVIGVESEGDLKKCSHKDACGPMQLMQSIATGVCKIKISRWEDYRFHPESIECSAKFLKALIDRYGLVLGLQAYNAGERIINEINKNARWKENCERLLPETCWYPVKVLAMKNLCEYHKKINPNIGISVYDIYHNTDFISIKHGYTIWGIAKKYNIPVNLIKKLNPQIKDYNKLYPGQKIFIPKIKKIAKNIEKNKKNISKIKKRRKDK